MRDFDQVISQEKNRINFIINHYFDDAPESLPKEINSRILLANSRGLYWFHRMKSIEKTGNIMSSNATKKFQQCLRIHAFYMNKFLQWIKNLNK